MSGKYWDQPWSLVQGCTPVSPACNNCWCAAEAHTRQHQKNPKIKEQYSGLTDNDGCFNGTVRIRPDRLDIPLKRQKPTVYAVWSDLFHPDVPMSFQVEAFNIMGKAKHHTFLILTKRPENLLELVRVAIDCKGAFDGFPEHVWIGVTAENQEQADKRIPILLQIPAAKRFVSIEPMLGPINLESCAMCGSFPAVEGQNCIDAESLAGVILGGESGTGARPMHPDWVRGVRDQFQAAGVPFFFKQWGEWAEWAMVAESCQGRTAKAQMVTHGLSNILMMKVGMKTAGRLLDGREHNELPWRSDG